MAAVGAVKKIKESLGRSSAMKQIEFTFYAPEAKKVYIAGTFNDWNPKLMLMKKGKDGTWRILIKLSPGKHEYKYIVDGTWAADSSGAEVVPNPYGTNNCVISVD
jgi:1,4-alpha-glucan branching enzyme